MSDIVISALFVATNGQYWGRQDVDPWDLDRDARLYQGPHPVVAHPPCAAWSKLAPLREWKYGYKREEDGGCFESALKSVRTFGGVLEHPEGSAAWKRFGIQKPIFGKWMPSSRPNEWVTEVWQVDYGHRARKRTWLLYVGERPPGALRWEKRQHVAVVSGSKNHTTRPTCGGARVWSREASATPKQFADELISLAKNSRSNENKK